MVWCKVSQHCDYNLVTQVSQNCDYNQITQGSLPGRCRVTQSNWRAISVLKSPHDTSRGNDQWLSGLISASGYERDKISIEFNLNSLFFYFSDSQRLPIGSMKTQVTYLSKHKIVLGKQNTECFCLRIKTPVHISGVVGSLIVAVIISHLVPSSWVSLNLVSLSWNLVRSSLKPSYHHRVWFSSFFHICSKIKRSLSFSNLSSLLFNWFCYPSIADFLFHFSLL